MIRRKIVGLAVMALLAATTTLTPGAGNAVHGAPQLGADPRGNLVVGGLKLMIGRATSTRIFRNVDEISAAMNAQYQAHLQTASAQGDARTVQLLHEEQAAMQNMLDGVRQNGYVQYRRPEALLLLRTLANSSQAGRVIDGASRDMAALAGQIQALRTAISGGGSPLEQVSKLADNIERWRLVWSMTTGASGRALAAAADKASSSLRAVSTTGSDADAALATVQSDLQGLSQALSDLQQVPRRPRNGASVFGFIANVLGADRTVLDALSEIFNPRLRNVPGYDKAKLDKALRAALVEIVRRRITDCTKQTGNAIRRLADDPAAGLPFPGDLPTTSGATGEQLPVCQDLTGEQLLDIGETAVAVVPQPGDAPTDRPSGGGYYALDSTTTDPSAVARMVRIPSSDLSVREVTDGGLISLGGEAVGRPDIQLVLDLGAGTVSGSFAATYECDPTSCIFTAAQGSASATFENLPLGIAPVDPPDDFPFPPHHWYAPSADVWYAGGAVPVAITLSGTDMNGNPVGYDTTVTAWVSVQLSGYGGYQPGSRPDGWRASFAISIDHPDTVNPQWFLWAGADADIWDGNIPRPPGGN